ncbi:uncharacterized protein N7496_008400 [Penicillium cataractarum]|uniref:Zn(2)-C6 fungal-type domain-containing protein n=1 Tax=Penicillium cataractarum TaxID=2100454 RepID=A0A9W9RZM1_9EURO|nr:uncharacterized protein N7496_008400 [Penicillium cataractarum]KAJ5368640.1 hypothetical protein N7496_008400 [Penicillium cataractarum]
MASSDTKRKDASSARHRSHKGCWTCKRKRIQCDETRPGCQKCSSRGVTCEGYEIRLRWGAGIASRGRYSGAEKPVKEFIPPPSKRRWDLRDKGEQREEGDHQGQPVLLFSSSSSDVRSMTRLNQPVYERPTVNILNVPHGENQNDYIHIKKHFELPASMRDFESAQEHLLGGRSTQYSKNITGRSAILA